MIRSLSILTAFSLGLLVAVGCSDDADNKKDAGVTADVGSQTDLGAKTDGTTKDSGGTTKDSGGTTKDSGGTSDWKKFFTDHAGTYKGKATLLQKAGSDYVDKNVEYLLKLEASGKVTFLATKKGDVSSTYDDADGDTFQVVAATTSVVIRNPASAQSLVVSVAYTTNLGMTASISILDASGTVPAVVAGWSLGLMTKL